MKKSLLILFAILLTFSAFARSEKDKEESAERAGLKFQPLTYTASRDSLLYESFEDSVITEDWTILNNDANDFQWEVTDFYAAHTGNFVAMVSYNSSGNDDWLITPAINLDGDQMLEFWAKSSSNNFLEEFSVLISTTGIDTTSFVVLEEFINHSSSWTEHSYDLSSYSGDVYIAFHSTSINEAELLIDDVLIKDLPETPLASLNYNSIDFDEVEVGTTANPFGNIIELTNVDAAELAISSITNLTGTNFTSNFDTNITLLADSTYAFGFEYSPTSDVADSVYFEIVTNGGTVGVGLKGTGYVLEDNQIQIGRDSFTNTHLPLEPWYNYSYSQTLYLQEDLNTDFELLKSLSYRYTGLAITDAITLYMGHTSQDTLSDWMAFEELTQVYQGSLSTEDGTNWTEIMLDTPFAYNNNDNLIIAIIETQEGYHNMNDDFLASETEQAMSLVFYSDTEVPDPSSPPEPELMRFTPNTRFTLMNMPDFNPILNLIANVENAEIIWDTPDIDPNSNFIRYDIYHDSFLIDSTEETYYSLIGFPPGNGIVIGIKAVYVLGESEIVEVTFDWEGTPYGDNNTVPVITALQGNYPNPFNPTTKINFSLKEAGKVNLEIYNLKGQKVKTLMNKNMDADNHSVIWSGEDNSGKKVSSGIYLYRMKSKGYSETKKMILIK